MRPYWANVPQSGAICSKNLQCNFIKLQTAALRRKCRRLWCRRYISHFYWHMTCTDGIHSRRRFRRGAAVCGCQIYSLLCKLRTVSKFSSIQCWFFDETSAVYTLKVILCNCTGSFINLLINLAIYIWDTVLIFVINQHSFAFKRETVYCIDVCKTSIQCWFSYENQHVRRLWCLVSFINHRSAAEVPASQPVCIERYLAGIRLYRRL